MQREENSDHVSLNHLSGVKPPLFFIAITIPIILMITTITVVHEDAKTIIFEIDEEDLISHQNENYRRFAVKYEDKSELFLDKALSDDDRNHDGNSTVMNCYRALKDNCPENERFSDFVLRYIQDFEYISDSEQYDSFDWAAYPIETLSSKKGDCEDLAILLISLLLHDYRCGIIVFKDHTVAMIACDADTSVEIEGFTPLSIEHEGLLYYAMEATVHCPPGYTFEEYQLGDVLSFRVV